MERARKRERDKVEWNSMFGTCFKANEQSCRVVKVRLFVPHFKITETCTMQGPGIFMSIAKSSVIVLFYRVLQLT